MLFKHIWKTISFVMLPFISSHGKSVFLFDPNDKGHVSLVFIDVDSFVVSVAEGLTCL